MQYRFLSPPVLLLLIAGACGLPDDFVIDITFDPCEPIVLLPAPDSTAAERRGVDEAIALWGAVMESGLTRDDHGDAQRLPISFEKAMPAFYGVYRDDEGAIVINRLLVEPRARAVVIAHELGHAFGLWHQEARRSVMRAGNTELPPSPGDAVLVEALWGACDERAGPLRELLVAPPPDPIPFSAAEG